MKATLLLSKLNKILKIADIKEKKAALNAFINNLSGQDLEFIEEEKINYSEKEKLAILKFQLKFSLSANEMQKYYGIRKNTLGNWREKCSDADLKLRLEILKGFFLTNHLQKLSGSR